MAGDEKRWPAPLHVFRSCIMSGRVLALMWLRIQNVMKIVLAGAVLAAMAMSLAGQTAQYRAPRADGKPDLNGVWQALNEANYDLEGHSARAAMALRPGPYGPVPAASVLALGAVGAVPPSLGVVEGGEIPYKPEALIKKKENQENWVSRDPEIKCYLPGVPRATYMPQPFRIFQNASQIFITYQFAGAVRNIFLKDPGPAPVDSWMGQSFGHWEGETLVVDVTGFNDQTWFDRAGNFHSDALHVVERYTRISPDVISYEATIEDPQVFTRPWKISMPLYRRQEKNATILDFKCVEFVEELMYGQWRKKPLDK
jgi:pimeloyl-ACP methyl ester carboxylesterase